MNVADRIKEIERRIQTMTRLLINARRTYTIGLHHTQHETGGSDVTSIAGKGGDIKIDDLATPDDNTDLNVGSKHGLCPKLSGNATDYLDGTGAWSVPGGGSGSEKVGLLQINESFDSLATGPIAGQGAYTDCGTWGFDGDGGANETALIADLGGGDKDLQIWQAIQVGVRKKKCTLAVTNEEGLLAGKIKFSWRCSDVDKSGDCGLQMLDGAGNVFGHLYFKATASKIYSYNGSTDSALAAVTDNTWVAVVLLFQSCEATGGFWHVFLDGVWQGRFSMRTTAGFITTFSFFVGNAAHAAASQMEINNFKVWNFWRCQT